MICFNGEFISEKQPILTASNRSFKYGEGLFETIKVYKGEILLSDYHFKRLFASLALLQIKKTIDRSLIEKKIQELCLQNKCMQLARVRLTVYRNNNNETDYIIEANQLDSEENELNEEGWKIGFYEDVRKQYDLFSNLKSANYLPYLMADRYAKNNALDEVLIRNSKGFICDGSKTNIFLIQGEKIKTPALTEACISGVMRQYIIDSFKKGDVIVEETQIAKNDLLAADELFLTNAIRGIRWVSSFEQKAYSNSRTKEIYTTVLSTIFR